MLWLWGAISGFQELVAVHGRDLGALFATLDSNAFARAEGGEVKVQRELWHRVEDPAWTKVGFTNGWMGIIDEIGCYPPEKLLVTRRSHAGC